MPPRPRYVEFSGDGKQRLEVLVHGAVAKYKHERAAIFLHRGECLDTNA
jgi:hypothetical protein